eukprot:83875_1
MVGWDHTCIVSTTYKVKCWGYNFHGQLGYGDTNNRGDEANEMGDNLLEIDLGSFTTSAPTADASITTSMDPTPTPTVDPTEISTTIVPTVDPTDIATTTSTHPTLPLTTDPTYATPITTGFDTTPVLTAFPIDSSNWESTPIATNHLSTVNPKSMPATDTSNVWMFVVLVCIAFTTTVLIVYCIRKCYLKRKKKMIDVDSIVIGTGNKHHVAMAYTVEGPQHTVADIEDVDEDKIWNNNVELVNKLYCTNGDDTVKTQSVGDTFQTNTFDFCPTNDQTMRSKSVSDNKGEEGRKVIQKASATKGLDVVMKNDEFEVIGETVGEESMKESKSETPEAMSPTTGQCSDCGLMKIGKVYEEDHMFYCIDCFNSYENV